MIGEEGQGLSYILHSLNPERILIGAESIGIGHDALRRATVYARERVVFDRSIDMNQGIQHPLAERWMYLESAWLMVQKATELNDLGKPCGAEANAAKFVAARARATMPPGKLSRYMAALAMQKNSTSSVYIASPH
ncbi:acyl-CoA dehydrogenase family protein [Parasphingorhabdus sp.]|jgi:acyl-CoA dehydrogenase|uniref:acyl-CoA dehydrogenase family protein n=1 Tax=Parasphingorhabdus sp. TaxID=2709688 RepID=UPI0032EDA5D3